MIDPDYRGGQVHKNEGVPLPGEASALVADDEYKIVLNLAASLSIQVPIAVSDVRVYQPLSS